MAALMVGGAILGAVFNVLMEKMVSPQVLDYFKHKRLNRKLLDKLRWKLNTIGKVLDDAEQQQISNQFVKNWLDGLRHVAYEADDILDEIAYYALQMEVEAGSQGQSSTVQKRKFPSALIPRRFSSCLNTRRRKLEDELEKRLEEILKALDVFLQEMDHLGLEKDAGVKPYTQKLLPPTSLVDESGVYGRDKDRDAIIELLLSDDDDASSKYPGVISIVGMGGVGKTTLAQLVYNDTRVKGKFELRAWVFVSEEMDARKVAKDILKEMGFSNCDTMSDNGLLCKLEEELKKKKILLVLDDVWSENEAEWESCLIPFKSVKRGSKIIVTTRSEKVASIKSTVPSYPLQMLSAKDCWDLFVHHAFGGETSGADNQELKAIGRKLVNKCEGLPLAVKALGSQLRWYKDVEVWERMLKSNLWDVKDDKILPALRLSYYSLPSYLKQCFAYCAVFPKDYGFEKEQLILLWMAEGFIVQPRGSNKEMAEIGDDYFQELVSTSFFQPLSTESSLFVMHDLMHDLAESVCGEFCLRLGEEKSSKPCKTTRHLSFVGTQVELEGIQEAFGLRTFLFLSGYTITPTNVLDFLVKLRCLRVLSLLGISKLTELPDSIGKLKHLRFLDLSGSSIKTLPEAVSNLYNLQTLILRCWWLGQLPDSIGKLKQLQYLDLTMTEIQTLPESISSLCNLQNLILSNVWNRTDLNAMPSDMGKLRKLKVLTDYVVEGSGKGIEELWKLQELHESLGIWNLENVLESQDDFGLILMGMKYLNTVELHWKGFADNSQHVLEQLRPHANMKSLVISGYGGASFPSWVGDSSFSNVVSLRLIECANCSSFPPLGQLESLKELGMADFPEVKTVGAEFYGRSAKKPFRALERLTIENMEQWNEWVYEAEKYQDSAFPSLQELVIEKCPNLTKALPLHLFPQLKSLRLEQCNDLESLIAPEMVPSLTSLSISHCRNLKRLPAFTLFPSLLSLNIGGCNELDLLSEEGWPLPLKLKSVDIRDCHKLFAGRKNWNLQKLPCLSYLSISECDDLQSFPDVILLPSSLTSLTLSNLPNMQYIPEDGLPSSLTYLHLDSLENLESPDCKWLQQLASLDSLRFHKCPKLQSFPEKGLPSSISSLSVIGCPILEERCAMEKGEDWPKISHIPHTQISPTTHHACVIM